MAGLRLVSGNYLALILCAALLGRASGATIDVSTSAANAPDWLVTGAGASGASAFALNPAGFLNPPPVPSIGISSTGAQNGTFVAGASLSKFTGFWYADFPFALPANATNVSLSFSRLFGDDRIVLQLNGVTRGDFFLNGFVDSPPLVGPGSMSFPPGPPDVPYVFTGHRSGVITSGFLPGQTNDLRLIVNNTDDHDLNAPTVPFAIPGDTSEAALVGTVTFDVPEPLTLFPLVLAAAGCLARRRG